MCKVRLDGEEVGVLPADWTTDVISVGDGSYLISRVIDVDGREYQLEAGLIMAEILATSSRPEVRGAR